MSNMFELFANDEPIDLKEWQRQHREKFRAPPFQIHSQTSLEASISIQPKTGTLRERVYECIKANGPITDEGIARLLDMNPSTSRPRRIELCVQGLVEQTGTSKTTSGRNAALWSTTNKADA